MKWKNEVLLVFFMVLALSAFIGCQQSGLDTESVQGTINDERVVIPVEGMSCMSCVATVKKMLSDMDGVTEVMVSLEDKTATVSFDPALITLAQLQEGINKLGYRAGDPEGYSERR